MVLRIEDFKTVLRELPTSHTPLQFASLDVGLLSGGLIIAKFLTC
jgi:hypothetical protein